MSTFLFDPVWRNHLAPFTLTRSVASLTMGCCTIQDRWQQMSGMDMTIHTVPYLQPLYPALSNEMGIHTWIDASVLPTPAIVDLIAGLTPGTCWADEHGLIVGQLQMAPTDFQVESSLGYFQQIHELPTVQRLRHPWQMMQWNEQVLVQDWSLLTANKTSAAISSTNRLINPEKIFLEEGVSMEHCVLNASTGPIYIGKQATIMEGTVIRGPFAMGEYSVLKMNSKIYGATTIGPYCMGGGEIKNSILMGYSNKAHDGYLGDSVVGHWCNFGAGTSNSNLKNTGGNVKVWSEAANTYVEAGNKCGVMMGDYSRTAINSAINTGSMIGVSCHVFGEGLLPNIVDHFSWGVKGVRYEFDKAMQAIDHWKKLKGQSITEAEIAVLRTIFEKKTDGIN